MEVGVIMVIGLTVLHHVEAEPRPGQEVAQIPHLKMVEVTVMDMTLKHRIATQRHAQVSVQCAEQSEQ